jgi:hypothetical protein
MVKMPSFQSGVITSPGLVLDTYGTLTSRRTVICRSIASAPSIEIPLTPSIMTIIIIQVLASHATACQKAPFLPTSCGQSFVFFSSALARGLLTTTGAQIAFLVSARCRRQLLALRAKVELNSRRSSAVHMAWHGMAWHGMAWHGTPSKKAETRKCSVV